MLRLCIMTSSNGNIFRVTVPLCGEFTSHRWIPLTKASDVELWCFLRSAPWINVWVNNREAGDLRCHHTHYDVSVMDEVVVLIVHWITSLWLSDIIWHHLVAYNWVNNCPGKGLLPDSTKPLPIPVLTYLHGKYDCNLLLQLTDATAFMWS